MVDRCWQLLEERLERGRVVGVEGRGALSPELLRCALEAFGIAAGEDYIGTLSPCPSSCLETYACAAADHDDSLSDEFRFAPAGTRSSCGHDSSDGWCRRPITALPPDLALCIFSDTGRETSGIEVVKVADPDVAIPEVPPQASWPAGAPGRTGTGMTRGWRDGRPGRIAQRRRLDYKRHSHLRPQLLISSSPAAKDG